MLIPATDGGGMFLSDLSPKDKPWDYFRVLSDKVAILYGTVGYEAYQTRMGQCSEWLKYKLLPNTESGELIFKLEDARFCRVPRCPICSWRKTLSWYARLIKGLPQVQTEYPTHRWLFLTLTVRNCPLNELRETITWMNAAWQRLSQRKQFPAIGYVRSLEVTRNPDDGTAHPHFHCLLLVPAGYFSKAGGYLSQVKWTELWQKSLRVDYDPIVDVRVVRPKPIHNGQVKSDSLVSGILEVAKYTVKPEDLIADAEWLGELTNQLYKLKSVTVAGVLKKYISDRDPDDLINTGLEDETEDLSEQEIRLVFNWYQQIQRYAKLVK